jgi:hypothetical protein
VGGAAVAAAARSGRRSGCRRNRRDLRPPSLTEFRRGGRKAQEDVGGTPKLQRAGLYDRALRAPVQILPTVDQAQLVLYRVTSALNFIFSESFVKPRSTGGFFFSSPDGAQNTPMHRPFIRLEPPSVQRLPPPENFFNTGNSVSLGGILDHRTLHPLSEHNLHSLRVKWGLTEPHIGNQA